MSPWTFDEYPRDPRCPICLGSPCVCFKSEDRVLVFQGGDLLCARCSSPLDDNSDCDVCGWDARKAWDPPEDSPSLYMRLTPGETPQGEVSDAV